MRLFIKLHYIVGLSLIFLWKNEAISNLEIKKNEHREIGIGNELPMNDRVGLTKI